MSPSKARANEVVRTPVTNDSFIQVTCNMNGKGQTWNKIYMNNDKAQRKEPELTI